MHGSLRWRDGMAFDATVDGHTFTLDAAPDHGGADAGPRPKPLLLVALGGCAAMDIVAILRKMRQPLATLDIDVDGELDTAQHPHTVKDLRVSVRAGGPVDPARLWRAVALSRDQYCGVAAMLRAHTPISYRVWLDGQELPEPA
jgi:putative redox protein